MYISRSVVEIKKSVGVRL